MRFLLLLTTLLLAACGSHGPKLKKDPTVDPLPQIKANLAFTCQHERIPEPSADSDLLFQYARWLQKNNQLKEDPAVDAEVERLYRIAAAHQHYKATINLVNGAFRSHFQVRGAERLRLSQELIDAGVATGYYFVGLFLQRGSAGLREDPAMALRYYRKAADEGSALGQARVADKLAPIDIAPDIARQMRRCAAEQGHGDAATDLGVDLAGDGLYEEALEAYQLGTAAGYSTSASFLMKGFRGPKPEDRLYYLAQEKDPERAARYERIWSILADYSYAQPSVPEINDIVPLPPAKLPPWDGTLKWLEAREANIPPPKPSEALIQQLAKARQLDPATGRPLPGSPHFIKVDAPAPVCDSGQPCPHAGYWQAVALTQNRLAHLHDGAIRRFEQGEILPTLLVRQNQPRLWPLPDRITVGEELVEWRMLGEA
jgi:TPR repeat protein